VQQRWSTGGRVCSRDGLQVGWCEAERRAARIYSKDSGVEWDAVDSVYSTGCETNLEKADKKTEHKI